MGKKREEPGERQDAYYGVIGVRIKMARKRKKWTQEYLAERAGYSSKHISNIENGEAKLSVEALINIANALELNGDSLLCENIVAGSKPILYQDMMELFEDCNEYEMQLLLNMLRSVKSTVRNNEFLKESFNPYSNRHIY